MFDLPVFGSDTHADFVGELGVEISIICNPPGPQVPVPTA